MQLFFLLLLSLLFSSCSSPQTKKASSYEGSKYNFTVVATMNRHLNLEPCGCTFHSQGGLAREWNLWQQWKNEGLKNALFVSGGNTFHYTDPHGPKLTPSERFTKAEFLVEGLNTLQLEGLGVVESDFQFPPKQLQSLKEKSRFPWISTNLKMKKNSLFVPYATYEKEGSSIAVFSLSKKPNKKNASFQWQAPESALSEAVALLPKDKKHFIIILSNLNKDERNRIIKAVPGINVWIGQEKEESISLAFDSLGRNTLFVQPEYFGRDYARMDVHSNGDWNAFRIPDYEDTSREEYQKYSSLLQETERELAGVKSQTERDTLEYNRKFYQSELTKRGFIAEANNPNAAVLSLTLTDLDDKLENGKNPLTQLVERYRQKVQETE